MGVRGLGGRGVVVDALPTFFVSWPNPCAFDFFGEVAGSGWEWRQVVGGGGGLETEGVGGERGWGRDRGTARERERRGR